MTTISFDLDGVIIQNPFARGVIPRIRAHIRLAPEFAGVATKEADRKIDAAIREVWSARMRRGQFVEAYDWDSIYHDVGRKFGAPSPPDVATLVKECCLEEGMIALLPGAREGLEALRAAGYGLAAATNGYYPYQLPVLEALGIAELFDSVLSPDRVGFAKPDANYFSTIPGLIAHVGDTLEHDVLGARRAGLVSVWLASDLPAAIRDSDIGKRVGHPEFSGFLGQSLANSLYRSFHADAQPHEYLPDIVLAGANDLPELARLLVDRPESERLPS